MHLKLKTTIENEEEEEEKAFMAAPCGHKQTKVCSHLIRIFISEIHVLVEAELQTL